MGAQTKNDIDLIIAYTQFSQVINKTIKDSRFGCGPCEVVDYYGYFVRRLYLIRQGRLTYGLR
jgi:hypothetical protein